MTPNTGKPQRRTRGHRDVAKAKKELAAAGAALLGMMTAIFRSAVGQCQRGWRWFL